MSTTPTTTDRICHAAIRTVTRDGLLAMTLDNVAKEAGISKGGVMYHFPTKELLVTAMLNYFSEQAERMLMTRVANDPEPRNRWARAMIGCFFPDPSGSDVQSPEGDVITPSVVQQFMLAALAAAANNPGIIEPLRQLGKRVRDRLLSDPDGGLDQLLIWLAIDGLFLWEFVGMIEPTEPLYCQIGAALRQKIAPVSTGTGDRPPTPRPKIAAGLKNKASL